MQKTDDAESKAALSSETLPPGTAVKGSSKSSGSSKVKTGQKSKASSDQDDDAEEIDEKDILPSSEIAEGDDEAEEEAAPVVKPPAPSKPTRSRKRSRSSAKTEDKSSYRPAALPKIIGPIQTTTLAREQAEAAKKTAVTARQVAAAAKLSEQHRYSEEELKEFKELILKKLVAAKQELEYLHDQISRRGNYNADDYDSRFRSLEDGAGTLEREQLNQHAARQIRYIDHLEKALVRIKNGTYGICRETGKLIAKERLRMVPHATLSIEAKKAQQ